MPYLLVTPTVSSVLEGLDLRHVRYTLHSLENPLFSRCLKTGVIQAGAVAEAGLELIFQPQPPNFWDYN